MQLFGTALTRAIGRGLKPDGDLNEELSKLRGYPIKSATDANAIVNAIRELPKIKSTDWKSCVHSLVSLFQDVESADDPAFPVLAEDGIQALLSLYDQLLEKIDDDHVNDLLFILKIFSMYGSPEGFERVVEAAKAPIAPGSYFWSMILKNCASDHPSCQKVMRELSNPIPEGFIAVSLLDAANYAILQGESIDHPFNSPQGLSRLRSWLEDDDPENFSYAVSATVALPLLDIDGRDDLLALAMDHLDVGVQLEAAWAAAKLGRRAGVSLLAQYCLNINHSVAACRYLKELNLEHAIPQEALDPRFEARSDFANWLAHPNELAEPPDDVEVVDTRELLWPGEDQPRPFWLLRYRLFDKSGFDKHKTGIGLVGSMTWCFFKDNFELRPPEDCYAIHCAWEMESHQLIEMTEVVKQSEYTHLLSKISLEGYQNCKVVQVAELSPKLSTTDRLVSFVEGTKDGEPGWVAIGSTNVSWYPAKQFPEDETLSYIVYIHLGRQLLGFSDEPDRARYLNVVKEPNNDEKVIQIFERLFVKLETGNTNQIKSLLNHDSPIQEHLDDYLAAKVATSSTTREEAFAGVYERLLKASVKLPKEVQCKAYDSFSILGRNFKEYIEFLSQSDQRQKIIELISVFAPFWEHNMGHSYLGNAAYKAENWDLAESYFLKLKEGMKSYVRYEEMSLLATIWHSRGQIELAKDLILECLVGTLSEIKESKYESDRKMFAEEYQFHRQTLISLYPNANELLEANKLPKDPLAWYYSSIDV